jgi:hypothetical protein
MTISLGTFITDLQTSSTDVMASLAPVVYLLLGIILGFYIIRFIVGLLRGDDMNSIINE